MKTNLIALTGMLLWVTAAAGWTPRRTEPTAGANLIAYQFSVGSTMKRDGDAGELFGTNTCYHVQQKRH